MRSNALVSDSFSLPIKKSNKSTVDWLKKIAKSNQKIHVFVYDIWL